MNGFFRVPAIPFDRAIYPPRIALSEDAFKLFIYECSAIGKRFGTHYCTHRASAKFLGFDESRHNVAKEELIRNNLVFLLRSGKSGNRYTSDKNYPKKQLRRKYWAIRKPPLVSIVKGINSLRLTKPPKEPRRDNSAAFHIGKISFEFIRVPMDFVQPKNARVPYLQSPLMKLTPSEIDVYFNILLQNREYWSGVNPNYIRYELEMPVNLWERYSLDLFLNPTKEWDGDLYIDPVLQDRTSLSVERLEQIIDSLIYKHELLEWKFWLATYCTYSEKRRSDEVSLLQLIHYLKEIRDAEHLYLLIVEEAILNNPYLLLVGQLCSRLKLDEKFESAVQRNRYALQFLSGKAVIGSKDGAKR